MKRALALLLLMTACGGDAFVTSRGDVDDANEMLAEGNYEGALTAYDALQSRNPRIAFNRGLALYHLKRWDEAVAAFDEARASQDPGMKAASYYHIGNVHARKALDAEAAGDKEGALEAWQAAADAYENALLIEPDHADAKHQLEVALFRVDPPCRMRNDDLEPNNLFSAAKPLELQPAQEKEAAPGERKATQAIWLCPDDEDWLSVSLEPGDRVTAKVKRTEGPDHAKAGLALWASDGQTRVQPPGQATQGEELPLNVEAGPIETAGDYRLQVANPRGDDFGASVEVSVRPACVRTEDEHEPNDALGAAKVLEPGEVPLRMCPASHDWFAVEVGEGESLKVTAQVQATSGELKLALTDASGEVLAEGAKGEQNTVTALAYGRPAGKVYIHAFGDEETEAVYMLKTEVIPVCPEREDDSEDNDTVATSAKLAPGDHEGLQLCPNDPDYFAVDVKAGESVVAHLSAEPLAGTPTLEVRNGDDEVVATGFPLEGGLLAMALDPGPGTYHVRVGGVADAKYDLKLQVLPACPEGNDTEETNDTADDAKLLEPPEQQPHAQPGAAPGGQGQPPKPTRKLLRICPGDADWFRVPVTPESPLMMASIQFVHEKGDLGLVEYEADGETRVAESDESTEEKNAEAVPVPPPQARVPDPTDYLLRIQGADAETQNFYLLSLQILPPQGKDQQQQQNQDQQQDQQDQQQDQQQQQQQQQQQEDQPRPDRSTMEKEMEREDEGERKNLEAERARQRVRHMPPPLKDW